MSMKHQEENILTIISNSNMSYIRWDKQNSWGFRQVYSFHLNIMDRDLAANCPSIHTILTEQKYRCGCGMAFKITKQDVRGCLSPAVLPRDCHNITCTLY